MNTAPMMLNDDERSFLRHLLNSTLEETRVEERRTQTTSYREFVSHNEQLIRNLLDKLGEPRSTWEEVGV